MTSQPDSGSDSGATPKPGQAEPTPSTVWGAKGFQVDRCDDGPGAMPRYCAHANGVGSWPVAWFYERVDAELWAKLANEHFAAATGRDLPRIAEGSEGNVPNQKAVSPTPAWLPVESGDQKDLGASQVSPAAGAEDIVAGQSPGAKETGQALGAIAVERLRQVSAEGWTREHDDKHRSGQLANAAAVYAMVGSSFGRTAWDRGQQPSLTEQIWPWDWTWFKPTGDPRRNLVKAGALILAEIERLDRASQPLPPPPSLIGENPQ